MILLEYIKLTGIIAQKTVVLHKKKKSYITWHLVLFCSCIVAFLCKTMFGVFRKNGKIQNTYMARNQSIWYVFAMLHIQDFTFVSWSRQTIYMHVFLTRMETSLVFTRLMLLLCLKQLGKWFCIFYRIPFPLDMYYVAAFMHLPVVWWLYCYHFCVL